MVNGPIVYRHYNAVMTRRSDGSPAKIARSKRFFCGECSSMLWLHDDEWKQVRRGVEWLILHQTLYSTNNTNPTLLPTHHQWVYPFASSIDSPNPLPSIPSDGAKIRVIMRGSCPSHVPIPEGAETYEKYGPGEGIEVSRKEWQW